MVDKHRDQELNLFPSDAAGEPKKPKREPAFVVPERHKLLFTIDCANAWILLTWTFAASGAPAAEMRIRCTALDTLTWELQRGENTETFESSHHRMSIRSKLRRLKTMFPLADNGFSAGSIPFEKRDGHVYSGKFEDLSVPVWVPEWQWIEGQIVAMATQLRPRFSPVARMFEEMEPSQRAFLKREERRLQEEKRALEAKRARILENQRRFEAARKERAARREKVVLEKARTAATSVSVPASEPSKPPPEVPVRIDSPALEFQSSLLPITDLRSFFLLERAALWWVSNQSDDLLALPYCSIEKLDYQIRTALRVIGPLRGRALLSDEVGLGKTIEAGLVAKEYLTRGMIKRFLILTVPSLVDQWEEELSEKFHLPVATTNHPSFRSDPDAFWRQNFAIVASLHTLKQPAHLAVAQTINWDLLVVDEAHYLRNRSSQAWQAVNSLPRQFLLLLTATPVQNSLEELYNLVTLLQPGQLPSPKEFRDRFIDKKSPHRPRESEELRRLLGQVMIRNTRANAGVDLPPRRAETILFDLDADERAFFEQWEKELRDHLSRMSASLGSLWGRLLLQTIGSSPAAWRDALKSFPEQTAADSWRRLAPFEASWIKKCALIAPLALEEGGVVVFTQYLRTQAALAEQLAAAGATTWVINGQTPAVQRQPITEEFRRKGGALLLTHSGTEGRNLQFCHRLVNFDLPWNPMEIEQRIGRLHRLGQQRPVRIYNLVQRHTLQEHLLEILQDKLNLFELVVGETGLILGDRFSSDEFAEEVFRRWRDADGNLAQAFETLGEELTTARENYVQVKQLDETLFAQDYESL
ncbi:MAG: DEAD/DEAH box helicase [Verrucomicrobia bacterium]|nr:DEAD/DEAH box helicase [Verrucomicrobiota bacterium]